MNKNVGKILRDQIVLAVMCNKLIDLNRCMLIFLFPSNGNSIGTRFINQYELARTKKKKKMREKHDVWQSVGRELS